MRRRALLVWSIGLLAILGTAAPALAGTGGGRPHDGGGRISVDGGLLVGADELVDGPVISIDGDVQVDGEVRGDIYIARGDLRVTGRVRDDILVLDGDVTVIGGVDGEIVVIGGRAIVKGGEAFVTGDIHSTDEPHVARDATVNGTVEKLGFDGLFGSLAFTLLMFMWLAITISTALLGLLYVWLFPRAVEASARASRDVGRSIAWGVGVGVVGPVLAVVSVVTLVGIPFGFGVGAALFALAGLGYVTSALCLGRTMIKTPGAGGRIGAFFAGFGILRFAALIPGLGALVGFVASVYGVGVLANAAWRSGRAGSPASPTTPESSASPEPDAPDVDTSSDAADETTTDADTGDDTASTTEPDVPATVAADDGDDD